MKHSTRKSRRLSVLAVVLVFIVLVVAGIYFLNRPTTRGITVEFPHIHGLGFSNDGNRLYVPAHIGLFVFENGSWSVPNIPAHDYMGYSAVDDGFYSSGHPDLRTDYEPLLGLIKSEDEGRTINVLAFEGESDFHVMGAGYRSHVVYVFNPSPNSRLSAGMFYTLDDGATWNQSRAAGSSGSPLHIAVHPTDPAAVALVTRNGLYLSRDYGDTFAPVGDITPVSAAAFAPDGSTLLLGHQSLYALDLTSGETTPIQTPAIAQDDVIVFIAVNPATNEIAFATMDRSIYLSQGNRQSWVQIADQGVGRSI